MLKLASQLNVLLVLIIGSLLLQGCMDVATTGAQAVYNRRNIQKNFGDQYITMQAFRAINHKGSDFKDTNISIATYNREILLAGQVPQAWQKEEAGRLMQDIPDVKEVYNLLSISSPSSTITRMSDAWITAKIKSKMLVSEDVDSSLVKVVTENGTVYLMGTLEPEQANAAVDIASNTDGVLNVVRIFSYITISKKLPV